MLVSALIAHHPYGADGGEKYRTCLPYMVVETCAVGHGVVVHLLYVDIVGILQDTHFLTGDVAKDADSQTRTGERMTLDETFGHAHLVAYTAHLVLEEPSERFAELQVHLLGQTANVVVALDDHACNAQALYAVWVNRSLSQPFGIGYLLRLSIEDLYKVAADNLAFLLRVGYPLQVLEELFRSVHTYNVQPRPL